MSAFIDPNAVSIEIGGLRLQGWKTVSITKSCESMPNSWAVTASTQFMRGPALAGTQPGQACNVYIGSDLVITGWIDRRTIKANPDDHEVTLQGRGITRNLVDCSVDFSQPPLHGGTGQFTSCLDLATKLSAAYGIKCRSAVANLGPPILNLVLNYGETPYSVIESAARYASYLVYEDETGTLVLDQIASQTHASGFAMPGNIETIHAERSVDGRYSDYLVVWQAVGQLNDLGPLLNQRTPDGAVVDKTLGEFRKKIIVSSAVTPGMDFAMNEAKWLKARSIGRSQAASITCDSWRDKAGKLWTPNWLAPLDAPLADIAQGATWAIGAVTFRKDMSGTHADLVLMPKEAFSPEPNPLNLYDNQVVQAPRTAQSPAPPSTQTPGPS